MILIRRSAGTFLFITLSTAIALFAMVQNNNKPSQTPSFASVSIKTTPTPAETEQTSIMDSPEGSKTLTLESLERGGSSLYSLFVSSKSEEQKQQIFKKDEPESQSLLIPFNTWSPDNVYFFIKEKTSGLDNYLVFQSSGNLFSNDLASLSIQEEFQKKVKDYVIEDVTGWAAPNLLIVNTKAIESEQKASFWFDVPSQSFIQLGTYFK